MNIKPLSVIILLVFLVPSVSAIDVSACGTLSTTLENYVLTTDIKATTGTCLTIGASDIVIDGNGHTISYANTTSGAGILGNTRTNITVKNVNIITMNDTFAASLTAIAGMSLTKVNDSIFENNTIGTYNSSGIYVQDTRNNTIRNNTINGTLRGIYFKTGDNYTIDSNHLYSNVTTSTVYGNVALTVDVGSNNTISNNTMSSQQYGIQYSSTFSNNIFYNNSINSSNEAIQSTTALAVNNTFNSNYVVSRSVGISIQNANNNSIVNNSVLSNLSYSVILISSENNTLRNNYIHSNGSYGLYLQSDDNLLDSNTFASDSSYGVYMLSVTYVNNTFTNSTVYSPYASTNGTHQILMMGDSITWGLSGTVVPGGYGRFLYNYLQSADPGVWTVSNLGIPSETSYSGARRFEDDLDIYQPEVVTIMYGINDLAGGTPEQLIINNITNMANLSISRGIRTYILTTTNTSGNSGTIRRLDINMTTQAQGLGIPVINTYDAVDTIPNNGQYDNFYNYTADGTHFTDTGYQLLGYKIFLQIYYDFYPQRTAECQNADNSINVALSLVGIILIVGSAIALITMLSSGNASGIVIVSTIGVTILGSIFLIVGIFVTATITNGLCGV